MKMTSLRMTLVLLLLAGTTRWVVGGHWARTRPYCQSGVPTQNYHTAKLAPKIVKMSNPQLPILNTTTPSSKVTDNPQSTPEIQIGKLFQWNDPTISLQQCSISQPALQVLKDGYWTLTLRADQNPVKTSVNDKQPFNPTAHIHRNTFVISVRCYATGNASNDAVQQGVGQPELIDIGPLTFTVENGESKSVRFSGEWKGDAKDIKDSMQAFNRIDRAEIDFTFLEAGTVLKTR